MVIHQNPHYHSLPWLLSLILQACFKETLFNTAPCPRNKCSQLIKEKSARQIDGGIFSFFFIFLLKMEPQMGSVRAGLVQIELDQFSQFWLEPTDSGQNQYKLWTGPNPLTQITLKFMLQIFVEDIQRASSRFLTKYLRPRLSSADKKEQHSPSKKGVHFTLKYMAQISIK